jgi:hypothetical protein
VINDIFNQCANPAEFEEQLDSSKDLFEEEDPKEIELRR